MPPPPDGTYEFIATAPVVTRVVYRIVDGALETGRTPPIPWIDPPGKFARGLEELAMDQTTGEFAGRYGPDVYTGKFRRLY